MMPVDNGTIANAVRKEYIVAEIKWN